MKYNGLGTIEDPVRLTPDDHRSHCSRVIFQAGIPGDAGIIDEVISIRRRSQPDAGAAAAVTWPASMVLTDRGPLPRRFGSHRHRFRFIGIDIPDGDHGLLPWAKRDRCCLVDSHGATGDDGDIILQTFHVDFWGSRDDKSNRWTIKDGMLGLELV